MRVSATQLLPAPLPPSEIAKFTETPEIAPESVPTANEHVCSKNSNYLEAFVWSFWRLSRFWHGTLLAVRDSFPAAGYFSRQIWERASPQEPRPTKNRRGSWAEILPKKVGVHD